MVSLDSVSLRYGAQVSVHQLSLELAAGQTTALIGPSGCGKSSVLRLLLGLARPSGGRIAIDGEQLTVDNVQALRRRVGYMVQQGGLFPHLSVYENAALLPRYLGWDRRRISARVDALAELTRLPPAVLARFPLELSGGQRQRVGLIRALMLDPAIVLLDEPLGALDPVGRAQLQHDLREIFRVLGKTVLLVTHDMTEAAFFADTIVLMRSGRVVQSGALSDLLHHPKEAFVTEFIGAQRSVSDVWGVA